MRRVACYSNAGSYLIFETPQLANQAICLRTWDRAGLGWDGWCSAGGIVHEYLARVVCVCVCVGGWVGGCVCKDSRVWVCIVLYSTVQSKVPPLLFPPPQVSTNS